MSIFDGGYDQAILEAARQLIDKPPAGLMENFSASKRITPNQFRRNNGKGALTSLKIPQGGLLLNQRHRVSLDITACENTTKVAQEADISMSNSGVQLRHVLR